MSMSALSLSSKLFSYSSKSNHGPTLTLSYAIPKNLALTLMSAEMRERQNRSGDCQCHTIASVSIKIQAFTEKDSH